MIGTNVDFQSGGRDFQAQFDTTDKEELKDLWWAFCLEEGIITNVEEANIDEE